MTKQEAKELALEKLRYYETQPFFHREYRLPDHILNKVKEAHARGAFLKEIVIVIPTALRVPTDTAKTAKTWYSSWLTGRKRRL